MSEPPVARTPPPSPSGDDRAPRRDGRTTSVLLAGCVLLAAAIAFVPGEPSAPGRGDSGEDPQAAAAGPAEARGTYGALNGRVSSSDGAPAAGVRVLVARPGVPGSERVVDTSADGSFRVPTLIPGIWFARASAPGQGAASASVTIPAEHAIELRLAPVGRIVGRVQGVDGLPARADIVIGGSGIWPARTVATREDGRYALEDVPAGVYEVQARTATESAEPRRGLSVAAGASLVVDFHLERGEAMVGHVIDAETERGIVGAQILVSQDALGIAPRALTSGEGGAFRLGGLRPTMHSISVHAEGYVPVVAREWAPGTPLRIALERGATLEGVVRDLRGHGIEGATLEILGDTRDQQPIAMDAQSAGFRSELFATQSASNLGVLEVTSGDVPPIPLEPGAMAMPSTSAVVTASGLVTDATGHFRITGVPPGHVQIVARHVGNVPATTERFWVAAGSERDGIVLELDVAGRVDGVVVDHEGHAVADVLIEHRSDAEPWPRTTVSDERGRFVLEEVSGAVTLRAMPRDGASVQERVDVAPGARTSITITLPAPGARLAGRTVDELGRVVDGAQVRLESMAPGDVPPRVTFSDAAGEWTFDEAGTGPWRITADHGDYAQGDPLDVDAATETARLVLREGSRVVGTIFDARSGEPLAASIAVVRDDPPPVTRTAAAGDDGSFVIARVAPGSYAIRAELAGYGIWNGTLQVPPPRHGVDVEVPRIELAPGASVEGDVVDALGHVVRGATIAIDGQETRTDARGHFVLSGIAVGAHDVVGSHPAAGEASRAITIIAARDPSPVVLRLPRRFDADSADTERALRHGVAMIVGEGARVVDVVAGSQADRAGVRAGDVVRSVDGTPVGRTADAERMLRGADGVAAIVDLERDGTPFRVRIVREAW